ncbi:hypothetical protein [Pseudomonas panipatensis]|uniref:hypothetical protein n=1 Tax=Pseudomonas panipatensis TaxID=428992 RepID=UPI00147D9649|nr:hypothetical protein [Pseudomonas panipatensis]
MPDLVLAVANSLAEHSIGHMGSQTIDGPGMRTSLKENAVDLQKDNKRQAQGNAESRG